MGGTNSTPNTHEEMLRNETLIDSSTEVRRVPHSKVVQEENKEFYPDTPKREVLSGQIIYPRKLFKEKKKIINFEQRNRDHKINIEVEEMDLEILLLNTLTITANKVQEIINEFLQGETYTSIFCFTETKVDSIYFKPVGVKLITKH